MKKILLAVALSLIAPLIHAQSPAAAPDLKIETYKEVAGKDLKAHVFALPPAAGQKPRAAIVLFHGGGWSEGSPEWVYAAAKRFAGRGMVALAIEYRLADRKFVTPLDALEDAKDAIRWVRARAGALGVDANRVVAYGVSAGGQLAAMTAVTPQGSARKEIGSSVPNAVLLRSPAVAVADSGYVKSLLMGKGNAADISPDQQVRAGQPPVYISQGDQDAVTPYADSLNYCEQMIRAGNTCLLNRFSGVGHLLSRKLDEQEAVFDSDPVVQADSQDREDKFLADRGFITAALPARFDSPETVVRAHLAAFNAHDINAMLKNVSEDFVWYNVAGDKMDVETKGRDALRTGMERYFRNLPSANSELDMLATNGSFVSVRERATWKNKQGEPRSQNAFSIYEVTEGQIRRVWYYPAQK